MKHEHDLSRAERQLEANKGCMVLMLIVMLSLLGIVLWLVQ